LPQAVYECELCGDPFKVEMEHLRGSYGYREPDLEFIVGEFKDPEISIDKVCGECEARIFRAVKEAIREIKAERYQKKAS